MNDDDLAQKFAHLLMSFHRVALEGADKEVRDAVVVKAVALIALAFNIPAIRGEPVNIPEALTKLQAALAVLKLKGIDQ
jgi:hypothetical protein